jgi:flagellar protein FlbT
MPLRIELAPNERVIIGNVSLRNGPRRAEFVVETQTTILRERDIITEREADTPAKCLYLALEMAYLSEDPVPAETAFMSQANELMQSWPEVAPTVARIFESLLAGDYYRALKRAKRLIAMEAERGGSGDAPPDLKQAC